MSCGPSERAGKRVGMRSSRVQGGALLLLGLCLGAQGTVWYVHPDSALSTIQGGLDSCAAGDTVLVAAGTYPENIFWPAVSGIKLLSESGSGVTVIDGRRATCVLYFPGLTPVDTTTVVRGFAIRNGEAASGGGICLVQSSPRLEQNVVEGCSATWGGGIYCGGSSSPLIVEDSILGCAAAHGGGVYCGDGSGPTLFGNAIAGNSPDGICCVRSSGYARISYNTIAGNSQYGIDCRRATAEIAGNRIAGHSSAGIICQFSGANPLVSGNTITGNSGFGGIACFDCSPRILGNRIVDNPGNGIACYWGCADPTIAGNEISNNQGSGVYCEEYAGPEISGDTIRLNRQGGVRSTRGSRPAITGNWIMENSSDSGGGICGSAAEITGNRIERNQAAGNGGGIACSGETRIACNIIRNNSAAGLGDGVFCRSGSAHINQNRIFDNGVGVYNADNRMMLDAEYNWWGSSTGPFHPVLNPDGLGDSTNRYVDPVPFLADSPVGITEPCPGPESRPGAVLNARGIVRIGESGGAGLYDIRGRRVAELLPGCNDISSLAPGVYIARLPESGRAVRIVLVR